ncbi:MAG: hypothetical protein K8H87_02395 [Pseudorhodoplanes sp.]|nr:hypothetical protein [Pseudorhodoplanes sp.]
MIDKKSQDIDLQTTQNGFKYHRGSALSIFKTDRYEDFVALFLALAITFAVFIFVK